MCRNIKTLHNFEPPATRDEICASSLQFVRKLCGFTKPSRANEAVFNRAGDEVAHAAQHFLEARHCHCDRCRKHSGTAVCTRARVRRDQFRLLQGEELIKVYGKGVGAVKAFCINCGSSLFGGDWPDAPQVSIRMGAFDDDPGIRPQFHTFVDDRAPWDTITDNLPQYSERRT